MKRSSSNAIRRYFRGAAQVRRVHFRVVPEAVVRALELRKGTADIELNSFTPDMVPVLAQQNDLAVTEEPGTLFSYISFNCEDASASPTRGAPGSDLCHGPRYARAHTNARAGARRRRSAAAQ